MFRRTVFSIMPKITIRTAKMIDQPKKVNKTKKDINCKFSFNYGYVCDNNPTCCKYNINNKAHKKYIFTDKQISYAKYMSKLQLIFT